MKKHIKRLAIAFLVPISIFIFMGLFQGLSQFSYHYDLTKAIESYRMEPPYCFIYFTPPNGNENIKRIIGVYQIGEDFELVLAENNYSDIMVNTCKSKFLFGKKQYRPLMIHGALSEKEDVEVEFDNLTLIVELVENMDKVEDLSVVYSVEYNDSYIIIKDKTSDISPS